MKQTVIIGFAASTLALSACAQPEHLGRDFGNSVHHNMAIHIINPAPVYAQPDIPNLDGDRAAGAIFRYKEGTVIEPEDIETTDVGGGS